VPGCVQGQGDVTQASGPGSDPAWPYQCRLPPEGRKAWRSLGKCASEALELSQQMTIRAAGGRQNFSQGGQGVTTDNPHTAGRTWLVRADLRSL